ncbi:MAG: ATPase domain-containing protein [bacterium]
MSFFICSTCGFGSATFLGKCPDCGEWNTLKQARGMDEKSDRKSSKTSEFVTTKLKEIQVVKGKGERYATGIHEFDRVLGGGFVPGHVALLTGEPGIGKSTLLLQALQHIDTLYISGEESASQIKDRADRLGVSLEHMAFSDTLQVEGIVAGISSLRGSAEGGDSLPRHVGVAISPGSRVKPGMTAGSAPHLIVIDSIQMLYSKSVEGTPGSVSQLRECALQLVRMAKEKHIAMIFIGHVTKDGDIAGPKIVEHMVDTVLSFEGEKISHFRVMRANKNRFGSTDEIGIFEMSGEGLKEVTNPLAFVQEVDTKGATPGRAIAGVLEGKRPIFFEIQSLASPTSLAMPRRVVNGVDYNKVQLLLAVIRKHLHLPLDGYDIYVNVIGGIKVESPAADLAIIASIISSVKEITLPPKSLFTGEVGLLGEVRKGYGLEKVVSEAKRIGLTEVYSPTTVKHVKDLLQSLK